MKTDKQATMVLFKDWKCRVIKKSYNNGRVALQLVDSITGESVAIATVNLPDVYVQRGTVLIKNWSENEGVLKALQEAGVIGESMGEVPTGFVVAHVCKLLI